MTLADHIDFLAIARRFAAQPYEWPMAPRFSDRKRWFVQLAGLADYEVWLTTWLPGQGTPVHVHETVGAVYVLRGQLEEVLEPDGQDGPEVIQILRSGFGRITAPTRHRIINSGPIPSTSIHVYASS
jgi:predicted metal-dependent enzyme (double-stranded beta helix superfamily)